MTDRLFGEDVLTIPDAWRRYLHPRRGGTPGPEVTPGPAAVRAAEKLVGKVEAAVESLLTGNAGDAALAEAARRHLDGDPDPAGAAALATVTTAAVDSPGPVVVQRTFVDAWAVAHGPGFAACAVVELEQMIAKPVPGGPWKGKWIGAGYRKWFGGAEAETIRRVRCLLASAGDRDHADAVERLAALRTAPVARWVVSYLVPERRDWLEECLTKPHTLARGYRWLWLCAASDVAQVSRPQMAFGWTDASPWVLATMLETFGADVLPVLVRSAGRGAQEDKVLFEAIAALPTDDAFQALLERAGDRRARAALLAASGRFPVRAARLLAASPSSDAAALLTDHMRAHGDTVAAALPGLPDGTRAVLEKVAASLVRVPEAAGDAVPMILADPPWTRPSRPLVAGLEPPAGRTAWAEGERDEWLASDVTSVEPPKDPDWDALAAEHRAGRTRPQESVALMVHGPEDVVRPLLPGWAGRSWWDTDDWSRLLLARYGLDALPMLLRMSEGGSERAALLMPCLDVEVALLMGDLLARRAKTAHIAREWFGRHGLDTVAFLVPAALGEAAGPRRAAEHALRHLDGDVVAAAKDAHGDEAAEAVGALLAAHPAETGLVTPPKIGDWMDPAALPQVLLRGRELALPADATRRLVELLAMPVRYDAEATRDLDRASVAEFGRALFRKWRDAGAPSKDTWALVQLGRSGDDETVRRLTPIVRAWPGEGGHKNAVTGLGVLAEIGSDVALMHLHGIAQKIKFKGLKGEAQVRIREVADRLGLGTEQLADRLVPTFGLDAAGSMTLDYGPRRFVVGFDERLRPVVADEDGKPRKSLPKPGAKDDPDLAPAAHAAFAALKKDVRTVAAAQVMRLERAMVTGRRWTGAEFQKFIAGHPLVRHLARRLVWLSDEKDAFRIAEDGTFADVADDAFTLAPSARVGVAHPLYLDVAAWSEVFADYAILQPFRQLGRPVHALTERERGGARLERFEGLKVPVGSVAGLVRFGWERGEPQGGGNEMWISRPVDGGRHLVIELHPGLSAMEFGATGDHQLLKRVWLDEQPGDYPSYRQERLDALPRLAELDPVTASEALTELTGLAEVAVP
ncbi:DUF4132 domain-containing protein [Actinomadura litoris]|uniref:DUF4132 domain-containing protein n=1 Tax=Actinomadura litoris TaxID=2678616 RepID=A0A7K1KWG8_9ACTN|nr:DUF4132 domain-containing protein [Actinomadura litoris]MUN36541.1 DUF4132 domain-containing protein [Actinomadura litoris]